MELSSAFTVVFSLLMKNLSPFDSSCISFKGIPLQFPTPSQPARAPHTDRDGRLLIRKKERTPAGGWLGLQPPSQSPAIRPK